MRLSDRVYLTLSGDMGCGLSHPRDCNAYAVDCGGPVLLIDAGAGTDTERLIRLLEADGVVRDRIASLALTHGHLDHSGGAAWLRRELGVEVIASVLTARALATGDEAAISLDQAKRAGIYPANARLEACTVDRVIAADTTWILGDVTVRAFPTPGHSADTLCYTVQTPEAMLAFPGDTVFHGGRVIVQSTYDCEPYKYAASLRALAQLPIDALFPGHGIWSLARGSVQVAKALPSVNALLLPPGAL